MAQQKQVPTAPVQAPTPKRWAPTAFLVALVTDYLAKAAPDENGAARASVHQSFALGTGAVLNDENGAPVLTAKGNPKYSGYLPGPATVYKVATEDGRITTADVPAVPAGRKFDRTTQQWVVIPAVPGGNRVPSFVEAVRMAEAAGSLISFRVAGGNYHLTLPGRLTARPAAGKTATSARDVLASL